MSAMRRSTSVTQTNYPHDHVFRLSKSFPVIQDICNHLGTADEEKKQKQIQNKTMRGY